MWEDGCGLGVFVGVLGLVGWCGDWLLVLYGGHDGCFGLGMELLGLMTFASAGGLPCGLLDGLERYFGFLCALVSFPLCWGACLGVANADLGSNHSLAGLKSGAE